jgi:hypothetical protein
MDYSLSQALGSLNGIENVLVLYDIMCQYGARLHDRFNESPFITLPDNIRLKTGIGIWHVNGHVPECFVRYAPLYISKVGHVDGEILETLWSSLNEISRSTRSMSTSHRRELLDDHMNDSNWMKLTRIGLFFQNIYYLCAGINVLNSFKLGKEIFQGCDTLGREQGCI